MAQSFRKYPAVDPETHVVVIGASKTASQSGQKQLGDAVCRATRRYRCRELGLLYTTGGDDVTAEVADHLDRHVIGLGRAGQSTIPPQELPVAALSWRSPRTMKSDLSGFAAAVRSVGPAPLARCLVVVTDTQGFIAATGHDLQFLGLCEADIARLDTSRPRVNRLHTELIRESRPRYPVSTS